MPRRLQALGEVEEVVGVPTPQRLPLAALVEALGRVLADGLQQREPVARGLDEALVDQRRNSVDVGVRNRLRSIEREAACEDGEPPEELLLLSRQKGVAPVDGRAQRPM